MARKIGLDGLSVDAVVDLTSLLNELERIGEKPTAHEAVNIGSEKAMAIMMENFSIRWDPEKGKWVWSQNGREILDS